MRKAPRLSAPSRSLTAGSFTITNSQFCALLPVGALSASSITRSTSPSSTGSGLSRRIARWVRIASSSGIEKSGAAVGGAGLVSSMLGLLGADQSTTRARWKPARRLVYNPPHVARPARQGRRRRRRLHALRRALRAEPRGPPLRRGRRGARGCGLRAGAHRGGVGGQRHVHLRRRRARRRAQALRPPQDAGAELLRLGHGCLPQRLPRDCCPTTDGAAAVVVCRADLARSFTGMPVWPLGIGLAAVSGQPYYKPSFDYLGFEATVRAAEQAYAQAKVTPAQVDFAEVHDCFTITEILNYEDLGFCARGEGGRFVEEGRADLGGEKPVNPSGGLKSYGHPVGATGVRMIYELATQLRGQAGARQVQGAKIGLAHNLGGPGAISSVSILTNQA